MGLMYGTIMSTIFAGSRPSGILYIYTGRAYIDPLSSRDTPAIQTIRVCEAQTGAPSSQVERASLLGDANGDIVLYKNQSRNEANKACANVCNQSVNKWRAI